MASDFSVKNIHDQMSKEYYRMGGKWYDGHTFDWQIVKKSINAVYTNMAKKTGWEYTYKEWK